MSDEIDYNSESDEDFCPDKAGGEAVSEEEESGDEEVPCNEAEGEVNTNKKQTAAKKRKRVSSKKSAKSKKSKNSSDEDDDDDDADDDGGIAQTRRITTRQSAATTNGKRTEERVTLAPDEEDTARTDSLWADFLKDTNTTSTTATATSTTTKPEKVSVAATTNGSSLKKEEQNDKKDEETKKVTITEILDFAGEEVRVEKTVSVDSLKAKSLSKDDTKPAIASGGFKRGLVNGNGLGGMRASTGGLGSILNQIGKKKKISVLEKTQLDWNTFKKAEGIEEQLQTHNKGKDGYLERQDFLQRTDLRQFEIEKSLRHARRNH